MDGRTLRRLERVGGVPLRAALCASLLLISRTAPARAQTLHRWTEIDSRGTAVDWGSLEQLQVPAQHQVSLIWARTLDREDTLVVEVAVRCAPAHVAIVTVQRPRPDGAIVVSGPVSLARLAWQDPPPLSYLAKVMRGVCSRTGEERRPC